LKPNVEACDYPYKSEVFMTHDEMQEAGSARAKINAHALNSPIIIEDDIQLTNVLM